MAGFIIKVTLEGTRPPVWRRLAIPEKIYFSDLHRMIQVAFGWFDAHLHEFTFPDDAMCVADPEISDEEEIVPERETMADDFLRSNRWIRYTYDFGDDWRHKIVLEKEDPSYDKRYGTVLKAKGDNFEEDSGGVWGESQWDEPYDVKEVNQILAQMEFPKAASAKSNIIAAEGRFGVKDEGSGIGGFDLESLGIDASEMESMEAMLEGMDEEELERAFQMMDQLYAIARRGIELNKKNPPSSSPLGKMRASWNEFYADKESWTEWIKEEEEESLLGCDDMSEDEGYFIEKEVTDRSWQDLLCKASRDELRSYCGYLQIPWKKSWTKKKIVEILLQCFREHPEYLLYVLDRDTLEALMKFCKAPEGDIPELEDGGMGISRMIALGMAEIRIKETDISEIAYVKISREAQDFLLGIGEKDWAFLYQRIDDISEKMRLLFLAYGLLEVDVLYQMLCETWKIQVEQEEFLRILYWHCRFCGLIQSGIDPEGRTEYVASMDLELVETLLDRRRYAADVEYPKFSVEELKERSGPLLEQSSSWALYGNYLVQVCGMEEEVMVEWVEMAFSAIRCGDSATDLMDGIFEIFQPSNLMEWTELWLCTMEICMQTGLPMLKGYSREEYAELTGTPAYELGLFAPEALEETALENHHLFELPMEMQCRIYYASKVKGEGGFAEELKDILQKSGNNYEVAFLLMNGYIFSQKFSKAKNLLLDLKRRLPGRDASVEEVLRFLKEREKAEKGNGEWDPFFLEEMKGGSQVPYRRKEAKVGRNAPCPCGSGKKYKNCCGKNK